MFGPLEYMTMRFVAAVTALCAALNFVSDVAGQDQPNAALKAPPAGATRPALQPAKESVNPEGVAKAEQLLKQAAKAYREIPTLIDTLKIESRSDMGGEQVQEVHFAFGPGGAGRMSFVGMDFIAVNQRLYITSDNAPDKYFATDLGENMLAALRKTLGSDGVMPPAI